MILFNPFLLFSCAKIAIFEPGASKILKIFWAGADKIPTILALASSKVLVVWRFGPHLLLLKPYHP